MLFKHSLLVFWCPKYNYYYHYYYIEIEPNLSPYIRKIEKIFANIDPHYSTLLYRFCSHDCKPITVKSSNLQRFQCSEAAYNNLSLWNNLQCFQCSEAAYNNLSLWNNLQGFQCSEAAYNNLSLWNNLKTSNSVNVTMKFQ